MRRAVIFDIQRFSIHDGPGIRTTVFFKGCPLRCIWCQNPESHNPKPEIAFYRHHCSGCLTCKETCTENAIFETPDQRIDYSQCTTCGQCVSVCSDEALKTIGTLWDADSLLIEIEKDKDFFLDSGGGITLSGGEPAMQPQFLQHFLPLVKTQDLHVNMETCGVFHWEKMKKVLPLLDLIYYDLKIMDPEQHKKYTGQDNQIILENFTRLAAAFPNLQARMPVIPSMNDSRRNIASTARFLKQCGQQSIHLLTYHNLGEAKLPAIQTRLKPLGLQNNPKDSLATAAALFEEEGIETICME